MFRQCYLGLAIICLFGSLTPLCAQEAMITVSGNIVDESGAVIPRAAIDIKIKQCKCSDCKNPQRCDCCPNQERAESNGEGRYTFTVPHGTYYVFVQARELKGEATLDLNEGSSITYDLHVSGKMRTQ